MCSAIHRTMGLQAGKRPLWHGSGRQAGCACPTRRFRLARSRKSRKRRTGTIAETTDERNWRHDFRLLWASSALSQFGTFATLTANPLLVLALTRSPVYAGWVTMASTVPMMLTYLPAGLFIDRFNRRRIMLLSQCIRLLASLSLVAALFSSHSPGLFLPVAAIAGGMSTVFFNISEITAVRQVVPSDELHDATARIEARNNIALLTGRPLGGFLYAVGRTLPYIVDVLACLLSIILLQRMRSSDFRPSESESSRQDADKSELLQAVWLVLRDPVLRTITFACAIANMGFQIVVLLLVVLARQQHLSSTWIGLLLATSGLFGMLGGMVAPWALRKLPLKTVVTVCVWLWLPLTAAVALWWQAVFGLLAWGSLSFAGTVINVALRSYQANEVPNSMLGKVASITSLVTQSTVPVGGLSFGYIIGVFGEHFAANAVVVGIMVLLLAVPLSLLITPSRLRTLSDRLKSGADHTAVARTAWQIAWDSLRQMWTVKDGRPHQLTADNVRLQLQTAEAAPNESTDG